MTTNVFDVILVINLNDISHIRNDVSSKQASKKTDFTVDLIIMVGLTKASPSK